MVAMRSLGLHMPAALSYLIREGFLPEDCPQDSYTWETFEDTDHVDELIYTDTHVVWSGGSNVYRVFSFDEERESVQQALFARFVSQDAIIHAPQTKAAETQLKLPKRADTGSGSAGNGSESNRRNPPSRGKALERALVVVLKSHAQIFFLSGARLIIPFSFEVDRVYPLEQGLILQRKQSSFKPATKETKKSLPSKTPLNSFTLSQSFASPFAASAPLPVPLSQTANNIAVPPFLKNLFDNAVAGYDTRAKASIPFHYHLADPFNDLGLLGSDTADRDSGKWSDAHGLLHQQEQLVYVSSKDEALSRSAAVQRDPLQLAVTINSSKQTLTVWQITRPSSQTHWRPHRRVNSYEADRKRRRRSSQPGTGAVTPSVRHSTGPRESFGGPQESFVGRDQVRDDGDLAAQLDPAFQNPRAPTQSSRRISSMLARSDLAGMEMFNDGAGAPPMPGGRRGASLGGMARTSRNLTGSKYDMSVSVRSESGGFDGEMSEDGEDPEKGPRHLLSTLMSSSKGLRVDLQLVQLHSTSLDPSIVAGLSVFSISSSRPGDQYDETTICIHSRHARELYLIEAQATLVKGSWQAKVTRQRRAPDIIDICVFRSNTGDKLAILSQAQNGSFDVTLQAPHTASFKVPVPLKLLVNFPFAMQASGSPNRNRETGPRRLVDDTPRFLKTIETGAGENQLIITDRTGARHMFTVVIEPQNAFVKKCIAVCEAAWNPQRAQRQRFLQGWWEATKYLDQQSDQLPDQEWTALIVLVLGLCSPPKTEISAQTPTRAKLKAGGLLRSSSGAASDLDSYYSALEGAGRGTAQPPWTKTPAWDWTLEEDLQDSASKEDLLGISSSAVATKKQSLVEKSSFIMDCVKLGQEFFKSAAGSQVLTDLKVEHDGKKTVTERSRLAKILLCALHLFREDAKLDRLASEDVDRLCPVLAQLGGWLGWSGWSWKPESTYFAETIIMGLYSFDENVHVVKTKPQLREPPSILRFVAETMQHEPTSSQRRFPRLKDVADVDPLAENLFAGLLSNIIKVQKLNEGPGSTRTQILDFLQQLSVKHTFLESLPEGIAAPLRAAVGLRQSEPGFSVESEKAEMLDRPDVESLNNPAVQVQTALRTLNLQSHLSLRDFHTVCRTLIESDNTHASKTDAGAEMDRIAVTRLIFKDDHRVAEAQKLLHPLEPPVVKCAREPEWSEQDLLEAEQELAKVVAVRTLSVSPGRGLLHFGSRSPLLTERFPTHGFTLSCVMKPSNNSITAEKETFTEEKVSWAFFHAGAEAGLSIARSARGIDTSWIVFNKPPEFNNRHAGFLLALGLNGHLRNLAKWVAFKYLTPKHTMTSVGLLLGLAASYLGTMDTLITRLLSVHVTRMLPPGAAELNLSAITQTTGILALGLLYCNTQHRRMAEVMLSEMENADDDTNDNPLNTLRDEGYRLAAGFSLGFINLGQGKNLKGLHDMHIVERLLSLAVSTKRVDLMHILDKGTAAATIAVALIFMKTEDEALARKIDVPSTPHQFEYIRPDLFLLRTVARHLIMWSKIEPSIVWIRRQLSPAFEDKHSLRNILVMDIKDLPLYNTIAGLCFAIGLRFAGTANMDACKVLLQYLDQFMRIVRLPVLSYDHRLTRTTVRNCQDIVALAASSVMAGTGNIDLFRRLRSLHGRVDPDTTYGSHLATHQAIGVLFLAGGTHTFKTSNLAVASLLCSFYPLFPAAVLDNKGHLQAFRHLWVLAVEPRCLVVRDVDNHRPVSMPVQIRLKTGGVLTANAPCLLPELSAIASVSLNDPKYWRLSLDFANHIHRQAFERHQSMFAAWKRVEDSRDSPFLITMQAEATHHDDDDPGREEGEGFSWVFELPSMSRLSAAERVSVLPSRMLGGSATMRTCAVDDRLTLSDAINASASDDLWNLKALFTWTEQQSTAQSGQIGWLEREVIGVLKAELSVILTQLEGISP